MDYTVELREVTGQPAAVVRGPRLAAGDQRVHGRRVRVLSLVLVGALILAINFAPVPNADRLTLALAAIALVALVLFFLRQRRAPNPLYDLEIAARPPFWVAACAGIIVFGSLMGAMFVGQQFLQNVLGYSTLDAGLAILPAAAAMVVVAPRPARSSRPAARGSRCCSATSSCCSAS